MEGKRKGAKQQKVAPPKKSKKADKGDEKKKRRKKANDGIKKPASAYIYFVSDYRKELKEKGKDTSNVQEVAKICGQKWREMSDEDKKPYTLLANKDKARYSKEREAFQKAQGKDPAKPKRPQTAYFYFLADFRAKNKGIQLKEGEKIPSLAGQAWQKMSKKEKDPYLEKVAEDRKRYDREMEAYKKNNPDAGKPAAKKKAAPKKPVEPEEESEEEEEEEEEEDEEEEEEEEDDDDESD